MPSQSELLQIVAQIYDAAADPASWNAVLERIRAVSHAGSAVLEVRQVGTERTAIAAVTGVDVDATSQYEHEYAPQNILLQRGASMLTEGAVLTDEMMCPPRDFLASAYYNEFLREVDVRYLLGGVVLANPTSRAILSVMRPHDMTGFTDGDRATLRQLVPHMQRALRFHFQISHLTAERDNMASTVDVLPFGVVFVEANGKISYFNAAADRVFRSDDGLSLRAGELLVGDPIAAATYRTLRSSAARTASGTAMDCAGGAIVVSRPSGRRSYWLSICPSRTGALIRPWHHRPGIVVFISDPEAQHLPPLETLGRAFGLTPAELRVVEAIFQSGTLAEAAEKLGVSRNTAHSQLNAVYQKTGTRTQAELTRMVFAAPARRIES